MSGGHAPSLFRPGATPLHRLRPQVKLAATFLFVLAVVATPPSQFWAFGVYLALLAAVAVVARVPPAFALRRLVIEVPFVAFALLLPFLARGERIDVLGLSLSSSGLLAGWNILAKATLGLLATVLLGATTSVRDLLHGLERLHLPRSFVSVAGFMVRYLDVILGEVSRMRIARESRGYDPRFLWQAKALAASAGTLFIRSYERGERVYLAMVSRGYAGSMPVLTDGRATPAQWATGLVLPLAAAAVMMLAWVRQR